MAATSPSGDFATFAAAQGLAPKRGDRCRACELPADVRAQVDAELRAGTYARQHIARFAVAQGYRHVTVPVLNYHVLQGHHDGRGRGA